MLSLIEVADSEIGIVSRETSGAKHGNNPMHSDFCIIILHKMFYFDNYIINATRGHF